MIKALILLLTVSCASAPHGEVEYYTGMTTIRSVQNKKILAQFPVLMRRTVDPFGKKIYEEIIQLSSRSKNRETTISFELIQNNHFAIQDEARLIRGHAYFKGPYWKWTSWTVHFSQIDGSVIQGIIEKSPQGITSHKTMSKPQGPILSIEERFQEVDLPTFKRLKKNIKN